MEAFAGPPSRPARSQTAPSVASRPWRLSGVRGAGRRRMPRHASSERAPLSSPLGREPRVPTARTSRAAAP